MIKTKDIAVTRGQTLPITFTVKDQNGNAQDLTGAAAYFWVRADMKVDAQIKLASQVTALHRVGVTISDQTGQYKGQFVVTMIPADTSALVALGADDPYFYDAWLVDVSGNKFPVIATSRMPLYPQVTTTP